MEIYKITIAIDNENKNFETYIENKQSAQEYYQKAKKGFGELNVTLSRYTKD